MYAVAMFVGFVVGVLLSEQTKKEVQRFVDRLKKKNK